MNQRVLLILGLATMGLLTACADQQANAYRKNPKVILYKNLSIARIITRLWEIPPNAGLLSK